ncbi:MAG: pentapeptide repeat-containing protein [Trichodesmium sp. St16_bin4-tuft]|nr:pentapeptide repeat-containing protein [Trichodesmium sp. St4_bin8_1]MDE5071023.1 pentapeptide repeat-containing protein [Trichodesmium sp. St5_bin8]MDE5079522.1 pentapeptide repeat-containing protein [Trichodesmium sp. St2_bin6]MDE5091380.1 pentapeptide repeat-containing protein [Trichodesmium sp. St18_bin3_1_1]MDE5099148.1 pentapeptide repeat-containing protein [Trichodesmium sp. St16_bin4-tuft]MDE5102744.1 pentapeptide repeat-containing protein [Trichodesmium sp. St19_bin2]
MENSEYLRENLGVINAALQQVKDGCQQLKDSVRNSEITAARNLINQGCNSIKYLAGRYFQKDFRVKELIKTLEYIQGYLQYFHLTYLAKKNLDGINLSGVNLNKVNLREASLIKAQLHRTKMVGANLDSANLKGANLSRANLKDAQASWVDLRNRNLSNTVLHNANLTGAYLDKSQSILEAKTMFARFNHARLPYGVVLVKYFRFFIKKR